MIDSLAQGKVDGSQELKWTVFESGRCPSAKLDGLRKWTVPES